jgi:DNA repair protein RAD50
VKYKEKRSEMRGAMNAEAKQCEDLISSLTTDRFRHIDQRYKTKLIDVKTHVLANQDLETYHRALDKALMHFHGLKMKEINETLKDYWRTVYKGSDIDEIYIVSDGAVVGSRRNYNYRVVMKQGDTELDMRGRCSAGQKVIASLLIRLALADTFCSQCAVLALDEPVSERTAQSTRTQQA